MRENSLKTESLLFQWNFFERTISNYSIIIRMFQNMEDEKDLTHQMPRVFVEETVFDSCEVIMKEDAVSTFFSIHDSLNIIGLDRLEKVKGTIFSPSVYHHAYGYGTLYIYPLRRAVHIFGYLILGKKKSIQLDTNMLRDLELLCEVLNRFILLNMHINELKAAEDIKMRQLDSRLATTKTLLENIIDQLPHSLFLVDRNGSVCFANKGAQKQLLEKKGLLIGEKIDNIISGLEAGFLEKDTVVRGEIEYRKGDAYKIYSMESYPLKDDKGDILFKSIVLKDVVDEKMQEEENLHRNRMESIGKLAGGVAHDFNNVLTGILGYASLMKRMAPPEGQLGRYAEVIENSAKRAASLTEHLLNFSRRQRNVSVDLVDMNALLEDILFLIRESFRSIAIEKEFEAGILAIKGDAGDLQHAILNLCVNAKDAMPDGGTLTIKTERKRYIGGTEFAVITIRDTGRGIDDELRKKIFEPFFTTKSESKKVGMGLYLVQKVVAGHGGFLELESEEGKGTAFTLYLPLAAPVEEAPKKTVVRSTDVRKRRILVVDDEEVVRTLLHGVLTDEGYEVIQAKDGLEGIAVFEKQKETIDLVILDMIMPGMMGEEVLEKLRLMSSSVKVIISSGFMSEEQRDKLKEHGVDAFLDKPYVDTDVIDLVKMVLSAEQQAET